MGEFIHQYQTALTWRQYHIVAESRETIPVRALSLASLGNPVNILLGASTFSPVKWEGVSEILHVEHLAQCMTARKLQWLLWPVAAIPEECRVGSIHIKKSMLLQASAERWLGWNTTKRLQRDNPTGSHSFIQQTQLSEYLPCARHRGTGATAWAQPLLSWEGKGGHVETRGKQGSRLRGSAGKGPDQIWRTQEN